MKNLLTAALLLLGVNSMAQCVVCSYPDWTIHRKFVIDNTANPDALTNFPVEITLDTSTPIGAGEMNADGSDIRVTGICDITDPLNFWVDNINTTSTSIWVNIPSVAAGSTDTIFIHYGNSSATSIADGSAVFTEFDDFESGLTGWTFSGGTWNTATFLGETALHATNLTTGSGIAALKNTSLGLTDYIVEMSFACDVDGSMGGPIFEHNDFSNYTSYHLMTGADLTMLSRINAGSPDYSESEAFVSTPNVWYDWTIEVNGTAGTINVSLDGSLQNTLTTVYTDGVGAWAYGSSSMNTYYDNILVRQMTSVEPTFYEINPDDVPPVADVDPLPDATAECSITPTAPTATDACVGAVTGTTTASFPITTPGTTTITWTYDDGNGNISTQDQDVVINDVTAPLADVDPLADVTAECSVTPTAPTATDNCDGAVTATTTTSFPITTQGTTVVTWTYTDANGNISTQDQNIVLDDVTAPVADVSPLPDVTDECSVTLTAPTGTDNCVGAVTATTTTSFPITDQGTTVVTWTYDDGNGNTVTEDQTVIITDVTAPVPDLTDLPDVTGDCSIDALTEPTATDNCGGTVTVTNDASLPIETAGTTVVTWTYDDGNGNTTTQTQNIILSGTGADATTTVDGITITANNTDATSYQWIDCHDMSPIAGETSIDFTPTADGDYAVIVTEGACTDTSDCVSIHGVGTAEWEVLNINIYPNPTNGNVTLDLGGLTNVSMLVHDVSGKLIYRASNLSNTHNFQLEGDAGLYILEVYTLNAKKEFKLILE